MVKSYPVPLVRMLVLSAMIQMTVKDILLDVVKKKMVANLARIDSSVKEESYPVQLVIILEQNVQTLTNVKEPW